MYRSTFFYTRPVAFVLLALVLFATMMLFNQRAAFAAENPAVAVSAAMAQEEKFGCPDDPNRPFEEGGALCTSDWIGYLGLGIASVVTVIVVDSAFLYYIYRRMQRGEELA